jgi:hypothetical protein
MREGSPSCKTRLKRRGHEHHGWESGRSCRTRRSCRSNLLLRCTYSSSNIRYRSAGRSRGKYGTRLDCQGAPSSDCRPRGKGRRHACWRHRTLPPTRMGEQQRRGGGGAGQLSRGASVWPLGHWRVKSTFLGHTQPSSSSHSELKLRCSLRFTGRKTPRPAGLQPSASISTVHRPVSALNSSQITPLRPFISGAAMRPSMRTRERSCRVSGCAAGDAGVWAGAGGEESELAP